MQSFSTVPRSIRIKTKGQLTIPEDISEALKLDELSRITIFRVGEVLLMTPRRLQRVLLAKEVEKEMKRKGLTLEEVLKLLRHHARLHLVNVVVMIKIEKSYQTLFFVYFIDQDKGTSYVNTALVLRNSLDLFEYF